MAQDSPESFPPSRQRSDGRKMTVNCAFLLQAISAVQPGKATSAGCLVALSPLRDAAGWSTSAHGRHPRNGTCLVALSGRLRLGTPTMLGNTYIHRTSIPGHLNGSALTRNT